MKGWQVALIVILSIIAIGLAIFGFCWWFFKKQKEKSEYEKLEGGTNDVVDFTIKDNFKQLLSKLTSDNVLMYSSLTNGNRAVSRYITWGFLEKPNNKSRTLALDNIIRECLNYVFGQSSKHNLPSNIKKEFICGLSLEHFQQAFVKK